MIRNIFARFRHFFKAKPFTPLPRIYVLFLPLLAIWLFSLAPISQAQYNIVALELTHHLPRSVSVAFRIPNNPEGTNPTSYQARLGSDGSWTDVTSQVVQNARNHYYTFTGLSPSTEYTFYMRGAGNGNTGDTLSVTGSTISTAIDYGARFCKRGNDLIMTLFGVNSPANANHIFNSLAVHFYIGQNSRSERVAFDFAPIDKSDLVHNIGELRAEQRLWIFFQQVTDSDTPQMISNRTYVYFGTHSFPSCGGGSSSSSSGGDYVPKPTATPIRDSLNYLPSGIQVSNWVDGAQGRRVGLEGVGRADLIAQGVLDAVDLWSFITPGVEVCFAQPGRVVFLDAAFSPRKLTDLPAYSRAGQSCATVDRAGTVVLLQGEIPPPLPLPGEVPPQILSDCEVQAWDMLNFRQSPPAGEVIDVTSNRDWLPASEKQHGYFKVSLWGREGWVSGDYVYTRGNCGG